METESANSRQVENRPNLTKTRLTKGRIRRFFADLGPGLITGAADDDPSGVSTYSVAGASFGYAPLWTALFSFPLMAAVQLMCARLGLVTRSGLASVIRRRYPRSVLWGACSLLMIANIINIGADLGGMAEATEMVTGINSLIWTPVFAVLILSFLFWSSYRHVARIFKWLTLVLFAYVLSAFFVKTDLRTVLLATFVPHFEWSSAYLAALVGILGTTISPYLFFWQAAEEVEEEHAKEQSPLGKRLEETKQKLRRAHTDVITGMFFSNFIMYFIILTTAATLHAHGRTDITTAQQAAEALRPLAGKGAYLLFTLGLIGTGMLGVPVLAGSCAYAVAEAKAWRGSLEDRPRLAPRFYAVLAVSMILGLTLDYAGFNAVAMLFGSAIVNGVLAPPLVALVVLLTSDRQIMGEHVNSRLLSLLGWTTTAVMTIASVMMIYMWLR